MRNEKANKKKAKIKVHQQAGIQKHLGLNHHDPHRYLPVELAVESPPRNDSPSEDRNCHEVQKHLWVWHQGWHCATTGLKSGKLGRFQLDRGGITSFLALFRRSPLLFYCLRWVTGFFALLNRCLSWRKGVSSNAKGNNVRTFIFEIWEASSMFVSCRESECKVVNVGRFFFLYT